MIEPQLLFLFTVLFLSLSTPLSAPFAHAHRKMCPCNINHSALSHRFPDGKDETRLYVRLVNHRDIKSKIHSANETDPPDKGIKEQNVNKGDTTNGGKE